LTFVGIKDSVGTALVYFRLLDNGGTLNGGVDSTVLDSFEIELGNLNDAPVLIDSISNLRVDEDSGLVSIHRFDSLFMDPDGDVLRYVISLSNGKALDSSSLDSIRLFTAKDSNGLVAITVTAIDPSGLYVSTEFDLNIFPVNDAPTGITLSANNVYENSPVGTLIGNLGTIDIDLSDAFEYELIETSVYQSNEFVQLSGNQIQVRLTDSLNYEVRKSFQIKIRSYDLDSAFVDSVFTINVLDVNDSPYRNGELADFVLEEDFADSVVIKLLDTLFIDPEGDDLTYTIKLFSNKVIGAVSADSITFKSILNDFGVDTLIITAEDIVGNKAYDTVFVTVNAVNDDPVVSDTTGSVTENTNNNTIVAVVTVVDVDNDVIVFEVMPEDSNYVIDTDGNIRLKDGVTLDYESFEEQNYKDTVWVVVSDGTVQDTVKVVLTIINQEEKSELEIVSVQDSTEIWTKKLDTIWSNSDEYKHSYKEDGFPVDSVVNIDSTLIKTGYGIQEVVRIYQDETKDYPDTVITYIAYNTVDPEIIYDTTELPIDSNGIFYTNDTNEIFIFDVEAKGVDPTKTIKTSISKTLDSTDEGLHQIIVSYTDIYGNTKVDTLNVILDLTAPDVQIIRPTDNYVLTSLFANVDWKADGELMKIDTVETLVEGYNVIIRSHADLAGNIGSDTVRVKVVLDGNKLDITLENEILNLGKDDPVEFEQKVTNYYNDRNRKEPTDESWNLSFKMPDDETGEFTTQTGYVEAFYHNGAKVTQVEEVNQVGYVLPADQQIGVSMNIEMQFPAMSTVSSLGDDNEKGTQGLCPDGQYMWDLGVDYMKVAIYDQLGQFVRAEVLDGFKVDPRYQSREGKVKARFDMPSLQTDIRASDGRRWAAGIYLMHIRIQTSAIGLNCNEGEKEISKIGTMKRQGYLRE
jgi:hypothetical protein